MNLACPVCWGLLILTPFCLFGNKRALALHDRLRARLGYRRDHTCGADCCGKETGPPA